MEMKKIIVGILFGALSFASSVPAFADGTKEFKEKKGFERHPKDIINTLSDNDVTSFHHLLEGLSAAYSLDNTLKNKGPFTLFAPDDKAFKNLPSKDWETLKANPKKLKQIMSYHIVAGDLNRAALAKLKKLKTMEGHSLTLGEANDYLTVDKAKVTTADIKCSNGVIHVVDDILMPPLSK